MSENDPLINQNRRKYYFIIIAIPIVIFFVVFIPLLVPTKIPIPRLNKLRALSSTHSERLILIGDVHGCYDQMIKLLDKCNYYKESDNVILLGDFLSKGPDSLEVLDYMMENEFKAVLGNHELSVLWKYSGYNPIEFIDGEVLNMGYEEHGKFDDELRLSLKLRPEQIEYLTSIPLILDLGKLNKHTRGIAVHIGLVEPYDLNDQKYNEMLRLDKKRWFKDFDKYMKKLDERYEVFYGHASSVGLNIGKYYNGLDTGCVNGDQLTALVINQNGEREIVSVNC